MIMNSAYVGDNGEQLTTCRLVLWRVVPSGQSKLFDEGVFFLCFGPCTFGMLREQCRADVTWTRDELRNSCRRRVVARPLADTKASTILRAKKGHMRGLLSKQNGQASMCAPAIWLHRQRRTCLYTRPPRNGGAFARAPNPVGTLTATSASSCVGRPLALCYRLLSRTPTPSFSLSA